jgi:hypothetical protein
MKHAVLSLMILGMTSMQAWSQTAEGPYGEAKNANLAQKIVHVLDNSTVGAIQTVLGASHILVFGILNPIRGKKFGVDTYNSKKSEISQLVVKTNAINAGAYSLGLFQVGDAHHDHEAGHSVASAALGPLYLPMVGLSYMIEGHWDSFFEAWADMEGDPEGYLNTTSAQIGLGRTEFNGEQADVVVMKFKIEQRQVQREENVESDKVLQWVNTKVIVPMLRKQGGDEKPFLVEVDLLRKRLNLVVDNIDIYLIGDQGLKINILTEQRYLSIENNPVLNRIHVKALDWSTQIGLQYNLSNKLFITPRLGVGLGAGGFSQGGSLFGKYDLAASISVLASLEINIMKYATISGQAQREWFTNGMSKTTYTGQVHNEFRDPFKKIGFIQYLDFSAGHKTETWQTPTFESRWSQWNTTLGLRF